MNNNDMDKSLNEEIIKLPKEISPDKELWSGIEHTINTPSSFIWHKEFSIAASIVCLIMLSSYLYLNTHLHQPASAVEGLINSLQTDHLNNKQQS